MRVRKPREAFTLLELIVVATLLVIVAAASFPAFDSWFRGSRLREGVDLVRALWVKGRAKAMVEGQPYRFLCTIGANQYSLAPGGWEYQSGAAVAAQTAASGGGAGLRTQATLPRDIVFAGWQENFGGGRPGSLIVLFWPDGTAKLVAADGSERPEAELIISDGHKLAWGLQLRSVTGTVTLVNRSGR
jgi:hypothetical protein